jgi:hypothetical protein
MRICLKCRNFYADETLKFCLADGAPLAGVDSTSELWPEGTEAVRKTASRVQRAMRRQKLRRTISTTVTTVLVVMVVTVVSLNSYIYLNPEAPQEEIAQAISPTPTPETVSELQPTPVIEETPTPTPATLADAIRETPTPTVGGDGKGPPRTPTPTPTPVIYVMDFPTPTPPPVPTPTRTPRGITPIINTVIGFPWKDLWKAKPKPAPTETPYTNNMPGPLRPSTPDRPPADTPRPDPTPGLKPTALKSTIDVWEASPLTPPPKETFTAALMPASSGCSVTDKLDLEETIKGRFTSAWEKEISESEEGVLLRKRFSWEKHIDFNNTKATLNLPLNVSVKPSKTCKKASVQISYLWHIESPKKQQDYGGERSYKCSKNGDTWDYQVERYRLFCIFTV